MNPIESTPIDAVESWSVPWHTLQKTLADAVGGNAPLHPLAARKRAPVTTRAVAGNWLVKAQHLGLSLPIALNVR
jgi:hypothetical protein